MDVFAAARAHAFNLLGYILFIVEVWNSNSICFTVPFCSVDPGGNPMRVILLLSRRVLESIHEDVGLFQLLFVGLAFSRNVLEEFAFSA